MAHLNNHWKEMIEIDEKNIEFYTKKHDELLLVSCTSGDLQEDRRDFIKREIQEAKNSVNFYLKHLSNQQNELWLQERLDSIRKVRAWKDAIDVPVTIEQPIIDHPAASLGCF